MLTNPRDAFRAQSRSPKVTFHMLLTVFEILAFSNTVTLKSGSKVTQGHRLIERIWLPIDVL